MQRSIALNQNDTQQNDLRYVKLTVGSSLHVERFESLTSVSLRFESVSSSMW